MYVYMTHVTLNSFYLQSFIFIALLVLLMNAQVHSGLSEISTQLYF